MERRNRICVLWDQKLKGESEKRAIPFVSIYKHLVDENNITKMEYFLDCCHLNSSKVFSMFVEEFKKVKVIGD